MSQSINVKRHHYDRNDKDISRIFYESKKIFACLIKREMVNLKKKTEDGEKVYFLKLQHRLSSKLIIHVREHQNFLWWTFHQMDFFSSDLKIQII